MPEPLLPLFPLGLVLFPNTVLPLHIFEERYKEMIGEAIGLETEFGVVLANERGIVNVGCTAKILRVAEKYPDGRMDIVTLGQQRFEIQALDHERSFLRGEIAYFFDADRTMNPGLRTRARDVFEAAFPEGDFAFEIEWEDDQLSFQLAQALPDLETKQVLLQMRLEDDRLHKLIEVLPTLGQRKKISEHVQKVAPTNGHGRHLKS